MWEEVIIHIGTHKTGSTSIQSSLYDDAGFLEGKGVFYPKGDLVRWCGHHPIAWKLGVAHPYYNPNLDYENLFCEVNQSNCSRLIISSEDFEFLGVSAIERLKSIFPSSKYSVVCYLRNPAKYLISDYQQNVKMYSSRFSGSVEEFFIKYNFYERINYYRLLERWALVFGVDSVMPFIYEDVGNVVEHFYGLLGVGKNACDSSNVSLDNVAVVALAGLNRFDRSEDAHRRLVEIFYDTSEEDFFRKSVLSKNVCESIVEKCKNNFDRLGSVFGLKVDSLYHIHEEYDKVASCDVKRRMSLVIDRLLSGL